MSNIRRIAEQDREAVRILLEGTEAFKAHEVDVAMELVDIALAQPSEDDYRPFVLVEEDGTVAAYACFGKNEMTAATYDLYWLATRADRMGRGHGRSATDTRDLLPVAFEGRGQPCMVIGADATA